MTTAESHLRAWADQAIRPVIREILRDELIDIFPTLCLTKFPEPEVNPYGDFKWLRETCSGVPQSTLRIKSASGEIPGIVKFGKRVLYEKTVVLNWLRSQTRQTVDMVKVEQAAELQVSSRLRKQTQKEGEPA